MDHAAVVNITGYPRLLPPHGLHTMLPCGKETLPDRVTCRLTVREPQPRLGRLEGFQTPELAMQSDLQQRSAELERRAISLFSGAVTRNGGDGGVAVRDAAVLQSEATDRFVWQGGVRGAPPPPRPP